MHDDDVTFTRILGPVDPADPALSAIPREHPALVWRPKLGGEEEIGTNHSRHGSSHSG